MYQTASHADLALKTTAISKSQPQSHRDGDGLKTLPPETVEKFLKEKRAESARFESEGYQTLNAEQTKEAFAKLDRVLNGLADTVIHTLDQTIPYLEKMQSLLSQKGSSRKRVLKAAGLPRWTKWAASFANKFDYSFRTVQERIKVFRTGNKSSHRSGSPLKLDARQQSSLVKAQVAANDLVSALKSGADWQTPLAEYEKVAVTPAKLDGFLSTLAPEPDWKKVLSQLVLKLEEFGEKLPVAIMAELTQIQPLLQAHATPLKIEFTTACSGSRNTQTPVTAGVQRDSADTANGSETNLPLIPGRQYSPRPHPKGGYGVYEYGSTTCVQRHPTEDDAWDAITETVQLPENEMRELLDGI